MRGYVAHHWSGLYDGVRADVFHNDPYVWFSPYLWSFCHLNQRPKLEEGMTVLWLSKVEGVYVCDLVFVIDKILPLHVARERYEPRDPALARDHFRLGIKSHPEYAASAHAKTCVADMSRSYIPHPSVTIERDVDDLRRREWAGAKDLAIAWSRPSVPLRIEAMDELARLVYERAPSRLTVLGSAAQVCGEPLDDRSVDSSGTIHRNGVDERSLHQGHSLTQEHTQRHGGPGRRPSRDAVGTPEAVPAERQGDHAS